MLTRQLSTRVQLKYMKAMKGQRLIFNNEKYSYRIVGYKRTVYEKYFKGAQRIIIFLTSFDLLEMYEQTTTTELEPPDLRQVHKELAGLNMLRALHHNINEWLSIVFTQKAKFGSKDHWTRP